MPAEEGDDGRRRLADHHVGRNADRHVDQHDGHHVAHHDGHRVDHYDDHHVDLYVGRQDDPGPPPENVRRYRETAVFATHPTTIHRSEDDLIPNCRIEGRFPEHHSDENHSDEIRWPRYVPCGNPPTLRHPSGSHRNEDHPNEAHRSEGRRNEGHRNEDRSHASHPNVRHPNSGDEMSHPRTGNDEDEGNQP